MNIDRRHELAHRDFVREYLTPLRPVIITDATRMWPALRKWTPEFFADRYGSLTVTVDARTMTLRELVDQVLVSSPEHPAPYLRNQLLAQWPADIRADVTPLPGCTKPNWLDSPLFPTRESLNYFEVFIGGRGAAFPVLHYDGLHTHAFIMEIYGDKEFWVYPPEESAFVYPRAGIEANKSQVEDVENPDLERFPLFSRATPTRFVLHAGETLFVPAGWWHTTRMLTAAISVSVNAANATNWKEFTHDFCAQLGRSRGAVRARVTSAYLGAMGMLLSGADLLALLL